MKNSAHAVTLCTLTNFEIPCTVWCRIHS